MIKRIALLSKTILLISVVSVDFLEEEIDQGSSSVTLPQDEFTEEQLNALDRQLSALYEMKGRRLLEAGSPFEAVVYFEQARRYDLAQQVYQEEYDKAVSFGEGLDYYDKARAYERKHKQCMAGGKTGGCY